LKYRDAKTEETGNKKKKQTRRKEKEEQKEKVGNCTKGVGQSDKQTCLVVSSSFGMQYLASYFFQKTF
jgi:hypothetical protein